MREQIVPRNVLVSGIPGSGKTTYCQWLEKEKGFLHLDFDELFQDRGTLEKLYLFGHLRRTAEDFITAISKKGQLTVIDWGFPLASLSLVRLFTLSGFPIWWFDGDRDAARSSFIRRATVPPEAFTAQMESIESGWFQIEDLIKDSVITVVSPGPTHVEPEYIYGRMFGK